jgi:voltage-gated potassium channel
MLLLAGVGFYFLEPTVHSLGEGLWLAFVTGSTVGYGDVVPTTTASRIFAVVMVLVGFALLSMVTATISAFFIGEDEKRTRREMHKDVRELRREVRELRDELGQLRREKVVRDRQP